MTVDAVCVCVCVCACVRACVCVYLAVHTHITTCIYTYTLPIIQVHACAPTHIHTSVPSVSRLPCVCLSPSSSTTSFPPPLHQVAVRLISGQLFFRPMLYSYQMSLPNLPLPPLQDTLERVCAYSVCVVLCDVGGVIRMCACVVCVYVCMYVYPLQCLSLSLPFPLPSPSPSPSSPLPSPLHCVHTCSI